MSTQEGALSIPEWTLSDRLIKARKHAGLEQSDMADYLGMAQTSISKYERGGPVRLGVLRLWAMRCGVPLEWLRDGEPPDGGPFRPRGGRRVPDAVDSEEDNQDHRLTLAAA